VFPDLEPHDVIEVRYRVDDVAHRNLFADYFGDLHVLQDFVPTLHMQYVLITPTTREIYRNTPRLPGLTYTQRIEGKRRIDTYVVQGQPPLRSEDDMPGVTEIAPYLHVSTYKSWQDVGRWYWGLIKDQLYADAALKRTVADLMIGATTTRQKVERIHGWAVKHTRYVALEFGIHGFLPYRVPLIVQRGFGDCKDKASLMYTMLREAGIDARIVLVRTRRNGAMEPAPASLSAFDHAITYVPGLDLYLDGTAEHSGIDELPSEDQGVMVLLVGPDGAELRQTPVHTADKNVRTRKLQVQLSADGSARIDGSEEVVGAEASGYREHYEATGTRTERLTRALAGTYPGVEVQSQRFEDLTSLSAPVRYSYRLRVPQLGRWDGNELQLPPTTLGDLVRNLTRTPTRLHPLVLSGAHTYLEERVVQLSAGLRVGTLPAGGEVSSPFGKLSVKVTQDKGVITARSELVMTRARVMPAEYAELRRWAEAAEQLLRQRIAVRRGEP
jgi:transglutaminase-like putative cysteine protease